MIAPKEGWTVFSSPNFTIIITLNYYSGMLMEMEMLLTCRYRYYLGVGGRVVSVLLVCADSVKWTRCFSRLGESKSFLAFQYSLHPL